MTNQVLNIAVGKFGKSVLFNKNKWGIIGGDYEPSKFILSIAEMFPNVHFWLCSRNDWDKLPEDIKSVYNANNNIHNVWETFPQQQVTNNFKPYMWPYKYLTENNINIDFGWFFSGPSIQVNLPNTIHNPKNNNEYYVALTFAQKYVAPLIYLLNKSKFKWVEMGVDPRYFPNVARDLLRPAELVLSTRNLTPKPKKRYTDENFITTKPTVTPIVNAQIDRFTLTGENYNNKLKYDFNSRTNLISVYCNGVRGTIAQKKLNVVTEYIFETIDPHATVYGQWEFDELSIKNKDYIKNFINIPMVDLESQMKNTKYTYMYQIEPGWCSSKYWKMIYHGIIPFFHPTADWDKTQPVPDFLRITSKEELKNKINYLEHNDDERRKIFEEIQNTLDISLFSGEFLSQLFINTLSKYIDKNVIDFLVENTKPLKNNMVKSLSR